MLQVEGSNPFARSENCEIAGNQKALALPEPPVALQARLSVRVLDLLRAIDGAAATGDLLAIRALTAIAVRHIESEASGAGEGAASGTPDGEGDAS